MQSSVPVSARTPPACVVVPVVVAHTLCARLSLGAPCRLSACLLLTTTRSIFVCLPRASSRASVQPTVGCPTRELASCVGRFSATEPRPCLCVRTWCSPDPATVSPLQCSLTLGVCARVPAIAPASACTFPHHHHRPIERLLSARALPPPDPAAPLSPSSPRCNVLTHPQPLSLQPPSCSCDCV